MGTSKTIAAKTLKNSEIISLGWKICTAINTGKHRNGFTWIWYVKEESFKHTGKIQPWNLLTPQWITFFTWYIVFNYFFMTISCLHIIPLPYPFLLLSCLFFLRSLPPVQVSFLVQVMFRLSSLLCVHACNGHALSRSHRFLVTLKGECSWVEERNV